MKKYISGLMMMILICSIATSAIAHDGWVQTNTPIIEPGEVSYVELLFGNHSNEHGSYRIVGTWNSDDTDVNIVTLDGEKIDISDTLFYTGEIEDGIVNNYYIGSFSASTSGIYVISAERDSIFSYGDSASRTLRSAKSFVAVSEVPTISAVQEFDGYDKQVTPDRAELIPLFNPVAATPDEEVSVQLLQGGKPLSDIEITLVQRSTAEAKRFMTDEEGIITFTTGPADYYLLRAMPSTEESVEGEYDLTNYEATMTFTVQNGSGLNQEESVFSNPFFYATLILGLAFIGSLIALLRK